MAFTISEENFNRLVKELQLEVESKPAKSIAHLRNTFSHIDSKHIKMTPTIGKTLFNGLKMKTFHISALNRIDDMANLVGANKKMPLSSFTYMTKDQLRKMGGIQTEGGIIYELEGTALFVGTGDIMSIPDDTYRRWLPWEYVIPSSLSNEYIETINNFKKSNVKPSFEDQRERIRYVVFYTNVVENFIKKHRDEIRNFVSKDRSSGYNEILIQQFEVKDVLMSVSNVSSYDTEYKWIIEYRELNDIMDKRELNEHELRRWKEYHKMLRDIKNKIESFATGDLTYTEDTKVALTWIKERGGMIDREEYRKTFKTITENKTNKKMSKKIKITEDQLKRIIEERKHTYANDTNEEEKFDIDQLKDKSNVKKPKEVKEQETTEYNSSVVKSEEGEMEESHYSNGFKESYRDEIESAVKKLSKVTPELLNNLDEKKRRRLEAEMSLYDDNVFSFIQDQIGNVDANEIVDFALDNEDKFGTEAQFVIFAIDDLTNILGIRDEDEDEEEDEDDSLMNESIKNIRNNFRRFL